MTKRLISTAIVLSLLLALMPALSEANSAIGQRVADLALQLVGTPYAYGGSDTTGFDASGLLVYTYGSYGASLPRTTAGQVGVGTAVSRANLRPGDIVIFSASGSQWSSIYVGNNSVVWSSSSSRKVKVASLSESSVARNYYGARRLPDSAFASLGKLIAMEAEHLVGARYEAGAAGTARFDASGFTQFVHQQFGIAIPRALASQHTDGAAVAPTQLTPGDIVFFGSGSSVTWAGIYLGDNSYMSASKSAGAVVKRELDTSSSSYLGAKRYFGDVPPLPPVPPEPPKPDLAAQIITTAEKYLGVPYVFGASGPDTFDCSGFTRFVYAQHKISIPRNSLSQSEAGVLVSTQNMKKGDLLIFVDTYKAGISHVAIYIEDGKFIHAVPATGVSYGSLNTTYWKTRLHSVRRIID